MVEQSLKFDSSPGGDASEQEGHSSWETDGSGRFRNAALDVRCLTCLLKLDETHGSTFFKACSGSCSKFWLLISITRLEQAFEAGDRAPSVFARQISPRPCPI
jgi:hypothetical protein